LKDLDTDSGVAEWSLVCVEARGNGGRCCGVLPCVRGGWQHWAAQRLGRERRVTWYAHRLAALGGEVVGAWAMLHRATWCA